jgi:Spy/CpxP family protein refolding chaperone
MRLNIINLLFYLMKKIALFLSCFAFCFLYNQMANAQTTVVRFTVELPGQGISQDSAVYLAGSFNGWAPQDENYRMKRVDARHYTLDVPCFANKNYEYKYTLGGWKHVEKSLDGKDIENRKFTSTKKLKVKDMVVAWNVPEPKKQEQSPLSGMLTQEQLGKMMQFKDSVTKSLAPVVPQLLGILQKINANLLADKPDPDLSKQYNTEAVNVVGRVLESLTGTLMRVMEVLTPEQRQKLREAMKSSSNPGDLINIISNAKATPADK